MHFWRKNKFKVHTRRQLFFVVGGVLVVVVVVVLGIGGKILNTQYPILWKSKNFLKGKEVRVMHKS